MISPIQKLATIITTIPMITRMPPREIPPTPAPLSALLFICSSVRWLMDECLEPTDTREGRDLLRFRRFLAGPAAGELGERGAAAVVDQPFRQAEDRPLDRQRADQLRPGKFAVLGLRRLLVVNQSPDPFEDLLAEESRDQAEDDADRGEDQLHCWAFEPEPLAAIAAAAAAPGTPTGASRFGQWRFGCCRPSASARAPSRRLSAPRRRFFQAYSLSASSVTIGWIFETVFVIFLVARISLLLGGLLVLRLVARLELDLLFRPRVPFLDLGAALALGVHLVAEEDRQVGDPEPEQQHDQPAE